jgi:GNAT superfamily N-acetyltransferase
MLAKNRGTNMGRVLFTVNHITKATSVECLATAPLYRKKGIAKRIMRQLIAERSDTDINLLAKSMDKTMTTYQLVKFYQSLGFTPIWDDWERHGADACPMFRKREK